MIYLDSCALIKLVIPEPESVALLDFLDGADEPLVSSELSTVEVHRALIRLEASEDAHGVADALLDGVTSLPLAAVIHDASRLPGQQLRSLAALHLAAALRVPTSQFISYDKRLCAAAGEAGLVVVSPS